MASSTAPPPQTDSLAAPPMPAKQPSPEPDFRFDTDDDKTGSDAEADLPPYTLHDAGAEPAHSLHVYHTIFSRTMTVTAGAKDDPLLYTVRLRHSPHAGLELRRVDASLAVPDNDKDAKGDVIGAAHMHPFRSTMELALHGGAPVQLVSTSALRSGYQYSSPAVGGAMRTWRGRRHLTCEGVADGAQSGPDAAPNRKTEVEPAAHAEEVPQLRGRFEVTRMSASELGVLETAAGVKTEEAEEMLISVLAVLEKRRRRRCAAGAAAGAASGGSGG